MKHRKKENAMSTKRSTVTPTAKLKMRVASRAWFTPIRGSYLPNSPAGWLTYVPFLAYLVFAMVVGWQQTNSTGMAVLFIVPNWVAASVVMTWIAARHATK
jgi:hypothetical protein